MVHITKIRARYEESDQMGFIHHSNHVVWMELARMNLFRACGVNYRELEADGYLLPVTKVVTKYVAPAYFDDEIEVHAAFTRLTSARIRVDYLLYRNNTELICFGYTEHCILKKDDKKPVRIPEGVHSMIKLSETAKCWKTAGML